jgi:dipeptidyl aminopeptidase/acylaminoacyl peptidase
LTSVALLAVLCWAAGGYAGRAQQVALDREAYLTPPKEIADAVLAARHETVTLTDISPDGKKFVVTKRDGLPPLQRLSRPHVYLGEVAFDHAAGRSRNLWVNSQVGFDIFYHADKRTVPVQVPERARVGNTVWSPDGSKLAFFAHFEDATHIYVADAETGYSRRLTATPVLATMVTSFQWSRDGKQIQTVLWPDDGKRDMPKTNGVPTEPKVRVSRGGTNPSRTYRFLLESPHDMKLLEHLVTGQVALINIYDGKVTKVGFPNMIRSVSMAPGESHFRVATMQKPFSYYVPLTNFGGQEGIWNLEGKNLYTLNERKLQDRGPPPTAPTAPPVATQPGAQDQDPAQPPGKGGKGGKIGKGGKGFGKGGQAGGPQGDPNAKRDLGWRPDGAGLSYLQLEPAKDKEDAATRKDRVMLWVPPFGKDDVKVVYETPHRIAALQYSEDCQTLFLTRTVDNQRQVVAVDLRDPKTINVIYKGPAGGAGGPGATPPAAKKDLPSDGDDSDEDGTTDEQKKGFGKGGAFGAGAGLGGPTLLIRSGRGEARVVRISGAGEVYLSGTDRPGEGKGLPKPFIDKVNIKTGVTARIFQGKSDLLETIDAVDNDNVSAVFTTRQKADVVPDSYVTELKDGKTTKLTNNVDHTPWFHKLQVQRFQVTRVDGFKFWVKVTTPAKHGGKLPALFWIYPKEYTDQAAYNRAAGAGGPGGAAAAGRFNAPGPRSMALLTLAGYAVVEPDVPIIGPTGRMNDNYIPDLRNGLWAVIDDLDKKGIIDRDRLAVGGHSYGAFSTANALAHTPFFKAGIAGDGNFNRTLTPMTFQTERRQIWDARETYLEMSPLLWANRVNGALLMYHGMDDANVGTNPLNSQHLFMALDGLGKPAALYMYPYEGHGPLARETTLDLWARWTAWLDRYVKNPSKKG